MSAQKAFEQIVEHANAHADQVDSPEPDHIIAWGEKYGLSAKVFERLDEDDAIQIEMVYAEDGYPIEESEEKHTDAESIIDRMDDVLAGGPYVHIVE